MPRNRSTKPASVRTARLRARLRAGIVVAPIEVRHDVVEVLMDLGWLPAAQSENRVSVGKAIADMLEELSAAHRRKRNA